MLAFAGAEVYFGNGFSLTGWFDGEFAGTRSNTRVTDGCAMRGESKLKRSPACLIAARGRQTFRRQCPGAALRS